ncbi:MAG: lysophospholipid acyltransferase family protein [Elusimicrobia bacterium]|nr:lysophospholipid acyltransferase family protein [Elusimicrobiota bacterium]
MLHEILWALSLAVISFLTRGMTDEKRYAWASRLGKKIPLFFPSKKRIVESNLTVINAWAGKTFTPEKVFENFAHTLSDFLSQPSTLSVEVEGREKADEVRRQSRGAIFLTSHIGHWELGGQILAGWKWPVTAVYKPYRLHSMQKFIQRRRAQGFHYLAVGRGAAMGVSRALERNETVAFLGDRPFGEDGTLVTMCGRKTRLPRGPFMFACHYSVPVIPGFVFMSRPGHYRAVVEDAIWPSGKGPDAIDEMLRKTAQILEQYISRYGDQWYCFEPVWEDIKDPGV